MYYDKIILGAGLYGLYSALFSAKQGNKVLVLEFDRSAFTRATYINQARIHKGYHYPRSLSTAMKSREYFDRFNADYGFCVQKSFDQVYATSSVFSWTNANQFKKFCIDADIRCDEIPTSKYFNDRMCDGAFLTNEYSFDASLLKCHFLDEISKFSCIDIQYSSKAHAIIKQDDLFILQTDYGDQYETSFLLNTTYASVNQIHSLIGFDHIKIKYELCEVILCDVGDSLKNIGITVMDGPFFSIMPFGNTGMHSLTSVTFTPHMVSYGALPDFPCQKTSSGYCTTKQLGNCNECTEKPRSAWPYMSSLAKKYLNEQYSFRYRSSLFSIKPILMSSEIDDSRPTVIRRYCRRPDFISVLSGKINTLYDLDEVLRNDN